MDRSRKPHFEEGAASHPLTRQTTSAAWRPFAVSAIWRGRLCHVRFPDAFHAELLRREDDAGYVFRWACFAAPDDPRPYSVQQDEIALYHELLEVARRAPSERVCELDPVRLLRLTEAPN